MRDLTLRDTHLKPNNGVTLVMQPAWLLLLLLLLCCCSLEVRAQATTFGPETYTRTTGEPTAVTKNFTVSKPTGSFLLTVESIADTNQRRPAVKALVRLNGTAILESDDANNFRVVKVVTLTRENSISVQLSGQPGSSIVLSIAQAPTYTLYTNPQEPLLMREQFPDGRTIEYFGKKNSRGAATGLNSANIISPQGEITSYTFDEQSRITEIQAPNGVKYNFDWSSNTAAQVTLTSPDGSIRVTAPVDFSTVAKQQAYSTDPQCKSCTNPVFNHSNRPYRKNHTQPSEFFPSTQEFLRLSSSGMPALDTREICLSIFNVLVKACSVISTGLGIPGARTVVCTALAGAIAATGYGLALLPFIAAGQCETVLMGVQLICGGIAAANAYDKGPGICDFVTKIVTGIETFIFGKGVLVSSSLQLSSGSYFVGQTISGGFRIVNRGRVRITLPKVLIGGRLAGNCPNGKCPDFTVTNNVKLSPGQSYNYSGNFTIPYEGTFNFSVTIQKSDGSWVIPVPPEGTAINQRSITVQRTAAKAVVSRSLTLASGPYRTGQRISGTFTVANRGSSNLVMKRVVIGGRVDGACPNNQCPDFNPVPSSITLGPNQTYSYSGTFTPSRAGSYTFSVAYEGSDGKWVIPVASENNNKNQLSISVGGVQPNLVVSKSLRVTPSPGPLPLGQQVNGSFSVTNRSSVPITMRQLLIGGRLGDACPNNVCPDFNPVSPNVTLNPGQSYNYSGRLVLSQPGSYTFYVAYETPDGKWEIPVKPENGTINRLSVLVQGPTPTLTRVSPTSVGMNANPQTVILYGTRLSKVIYGELRLPNGSVSYLYIPLRQLVKVTDDQARINAKFPVPGTYQVTVWSLEGKSNSYPITVH